MNFQLFKFCLLQKVDEFGKSSVSEGPPPDLDFDKWLEEFLIHLGYSIEDTPDANTNS